MSDGYYKRRKPQWLCDNVWSVTRESTPCYLIYPRQLAAGVLTHGHTVTTTSFRAVKGLTNLVCVLGLR